MKRQWKNSVCAAVVDFRKARSHGRCHLSECVAMLAIVKTIAKWYRAQISLHDRDHGSGLVVRLTFPGA